ncbi:hypothetical protein HWV00_12215 [Moritella sp. 24]|uniref:hypothetical protein n=1 Tax=Moritella sp. 24 TaxID=2746230 RepID=UPI001BAAF816|nr:hypothetical protein [Moritella sp. 24]QUM76942.1 hypothetical protein HWV00_12215 [Moritella sp. 24]
MSNFEIRDDEHGIGKVLILKGSWSNYVASYMKANNIYALRLTDSFGFKATDISFLSSLSFLKSLEIYCWEAKGLKVIESLPQLEVLGLQCKTSQKINLGNFNKLRVALITWSKGLASLLKLSSIEVLNIQNYPHMNLETISSISDLKQLYLTSRKLENLTGIEHLVNLSKLDLYNCPSLISLAGTELCANLKSIETEACNRVSA